MLSDPARCQVLLVTTPEETPVSETVETAKLLEEKAGTTLCAVVVNARLPVLSIACGDRARRAGGACSHGGRTAEPRGAGELVHCRTGARPAPRVAGGPGCQAGGRTAPRSTGTALLLQLRVRPGRARVPHRFFRGCSGRAGTRDAMSHDGPQEGGAIRGRGRGASRPRGGRKAEARARAEAETEAQAALEQGAQAEAEARAEAEGEAESRASRGGTRRG